MIQHLGKVDNADVFWEDSEKDVILVGKKADGRIRAFKYKWINKNIYVNESEISDYIKYSEINYMVGNTSSLKPYKEILKLIKEIDGKNDS